ncbi:MAG: PKD domain-containing protein [Patescibacteria group bacterium]
MENISSLVDKSQKPASKLSIVSFLFVLEVFVLGLSLLPTKNFPDSKSLKDPYAGFDVLSATDLRDNKDTLIITNTDESEMSLFNPVTLYVNESEITDKGINSYFWSSGDGVTYDSKTFTHTYKDEGVYEVQLLVVDSSGNTFSSSKAIRILAQ